MKTRIVLAILMLAAVILPAAAQVTDKIEIRGDVSQLISGSNFSIQKWDATNFAGFWYDIDNNKQTESLTIVKFKDNRTIDKDNLIYSTKRESQKYKVFKEKGGNYTIEHGLNVNLNKPASPAKGGYYAIVGWMAEKYVGVNGKNNKLAKLVLEQDVTDKKTLQIGETWDIGEGYTLTAQSIDAKATPRQAWLVLSKDGVKLDDKVVEQSAVYTYSKSFAAETDVPIFVTYVDSVFAGQNSDMVQLKYTWVISTKVTEVKSGDSFGIFEVDNESPLTLSNDASLSLSRDSTINLAGNMKFKVADSEDNDVRFYPSVEITTPGKYEVRGTVSQSTSGIENVTADFTVKEWNARNFAGFWYDIDENQDTEKLTIAEFKDNRTIDKDNLIYSTNRSAQKYKVFKEKGTGYTVEHGLNANLNKPSSPAKGGYYALVGWMAEKYIGVNGKNNKLARLVLEQDVTDKQTLQVGGVWDIGEGYTLTAQSIDAKAAPRQAWLVLSKDGVKLDDKVVEQGAVYTYSADFAGENDVPIFVTFVDSVFAGQTSDMVQLKYTWVVSTKVTEVKTGDSYGIFEVDTEQNPLSLRNDASLSLSRDSTIDLAGNMKFKVADSEDNDVRFYPKIDYQVGNATIPTPTPTGNKTATVPTQTATTTPTVNQTTIQPTPPPTETPKKTEAVPTEQKGTPGFEAIVAIVGLLAVACLVLRQKR